MIPAVLGTLAGSGGVLGDYELIQTQTVGSGGAASLTFSVPSGYTHLQLRGIARASGSAAGGDYINVITNAGNGTYYHDLVGNGSTASSASAASYALIQRIPSAYDATGIFGAFICDLLDSSSTTKNKTLRNIGGYETNATGRVYFNSSFWNSTSAITSVTLTPTLTGFAQYTAVSLYGIKSAGAVTSGTPTYDLIEERTLSSSSASETFGSGGTLTQAYKDLVLEVIGGASGTGAAIALRYNGDTATNYSHTEVVGNGGTAWSARRSAQTEVYGTFDAVNVSDTSLTVATFNLMSYANTNVNKTDLARVSTAVASYPGAGASAGLWRSTNAITSLTVLVPGKSFTAGSTFRLWAIKG